MVISSLGILRSILTHLSCSVYRLSVTRVSRSKSSSLVNRSGRAKVRTERRKGEINLFYLRKNWKKFRGKDRKKERENTILSFALKSVYFYDTFYTFCSQNCNNKGAVVIISQDFPVYFLGILNCPRR